MISSALIIGLKQEKGQLWNLGYNEPMKHLDLFDLIAPFYARFYAYQRKGYRRSLQLLEQAIALNAASFLDVGCGTGALSAELSAKFSVTGIDGSKNMIKEAKRLNPTLDFFVNDVSRGLPYPNRSFDVVISSYVLHGLTETQRLALLNEMKRVSSRFVIILDYHEGRHPLISIVEWLEHGDYFHFMDHFKTEIPLVFDQVQIVKLNRQSAFYILS